MQVPHGYKDKEPPVRDADRLLGVGTLKYDTTTNGQLNAEGVPQVLVSYKDHHATPDFLLTFRWREEV